MSVDPLALVPWGELVADPGRMLLLGLALMALGWGIHRLPGPLADESLRPPGRP